MKGQPDPLQALQRIKVGLIGLAAVVMLIAVASAVLRMATQEPPVMGSAQANVVAEMSSGNETAVSTGEPLAEMGAAPGAGPKADVPTPEPQSTAAPTA